MTCADWTDTHSYEEDYRNEQFENMLSGPVKECRCLNMHDDSWLSGVPGLYEWVSKQDSLTRIKEAIDKHNHEKKLKQLKSDLEKLSKEEREELVL